MESEKKNGKQYETNSAKKDNHNFFKTFIVIFSAIILYWILHNLSVISEFSKNILALFKPILYGFCIAYILNIFMNIAEKITDKLFKKHKIPFLLKRVICLVCSIILVAGIFIAVMLLIIPEITKTIQDLVNMLPDFLSQAEKFLTENFKLIKLNIPHFTIDTEKLNSEIGKIIPKIGTGFVNTTVDVTSSIFSAIFNFLVAIVFSLYMLIQKEKLSLALKKLLFAVLKKENATEIISYVNLINKTFSKFITGQLTEAVIIGSLCFMGMVILNIPYALIISVLVGFTALIPVFGAFIGTFIGAFLIVVVNPVKALWFVVFIVVLQQIEGNLIYPKIVGKSLGLPGILVLAAVTVGGSAFGVFGMLVAVPSVSVMYTIISSFTEKKLKEKKIEL